MPITHVTTPVPPAQVGQTEWAEAHTLPTADEIGALTTASADARYVLGSAGGFVTQASVADFLTSASASTVYARQVSAVTTAQLGVYLLSQDASTTYARQASAVTTAQLAVYLLSQDASTTYARQASAVTTAQLDPYLTSASASTVYARQVSAVTTAQLGVYLLSQDASTTYARQASAVTTAQLAVYLLSQDASTTYARQASAVTTAQLGSYLTSASASTGYASVAHVHSAGAITTGIMAVARLGSATPDTTVFLRGDGQWATVSVLVSTINITEASADLKYSTIASTVTTAQLGPYLTSSSADYKYGRTAFVTTDVVNATTVVTTLNDLIFSCSSSAIYQLAANLVWRSSATATGIGIQCSVTPTPSIYSFGADIRGFGADGAAGTYVGYASANADIILATSANAAAIDMPIFCEGTIITGGTNPSYIQLIFRSEVSGSDVRIRRGSNATLRKIGDA